MNVLVVNAGSSSLKYQLFDTTAGVVKAKGLCERIGIDGSKLTLNVACRNYMKHTGASIVDAFKVASYNPAKVVGLYDRGEIAKGKRADLVFVDIKMNVKNVILDGELVK